MSFTPALILTLGLDEESFVWLDGLRKMHFPPKLNFLPAHVTLFHFLPVEELHVILGDLEQVASELRALDLNFNEILFFGSGVGVGIKCIELLLLKQKLLRKWQKFPLKQQDLHPRAPHVTIQNKVSVDAAKKLYEEMSLQFTPRSGKGQSFLLWDYLGGPWNLLKEISF